MKLIFRLSVVLCAYATPIIASADEFTQLTERLKLLAKRAEVTAAELSLENERVKVAKARETAAGHLKKAAEDTAAAEAAAVKQAPNIKINSANLIRVIGQSRYCDATSFLRYNCHRTSKCGDAPNDTTLDADVCGLPGSADLPLLLEVNYSCGTVQKNETFPYGTKAYLVCE